MKAKTAFTLLELVFVIVIMGIIGKFGVEFLAQTYKGFVSSSTNARLEASTATAAEVIAARLQYRIKDSVIARTSPTATPVGVTSASGSNYVVLEWVGYDVEGFDGQLYTNSFYKPDWSGILDLDAGNATNLFSPETNTTAVDNMIQYLSGGTTTINDIALYFPGSNSDIQTGYGWDGNLTDVNNQQGTMHPVKNVAADIRMFTSSTAHDFNGTDVYEYYKLAWTAYALVIENYDANNDSTGTLKLYYNYQPWLGENFSTAQNVKSYTVMEKVSTFQFTAVDSILKIQLCVKSDLIEEYSICKEKTVF